MALRASIVYGLAFSCTCDAETIGVTTETRQVALEMGTWIAIVTYVSAVLHGEDCHDTFSVSGVNLFLPENEIKLDENFSYLNACKRCKVMIALRASLSR